MQLYNSVGAQSGIRAYAFDRLLHLCLRENCTDIMVERARAIVADSQAWTLTTEERKDLYVKTARALDSLEDSSHAFKVMHAYLKLFAADEDLAATEKDARRCVILAIKSVDVINFAELLELAAIKKLTEKQSQVFKLLNSLSTASAKDFAS